VRVSTRQVTITFWQAFNLWYKFRDRYIRDERHYYHALNYLHYNAVKHGYVESPYDWPWSSVHLYLDTYGRPWLRERWNKYPIGNAWDYGDEEGND